jgi:rubrerythrin
MSEAKSLPAGKIGSAEELMAIAHALELKAVRRYRELARRMREQGEHPLADVFEFLADIEEMHADQVVERSREITGKAPDLALVRWELPETFDEELARSATLTPYRALAIAVRNEDRAFAFFSYLAAGAPSKPLRQLAERFAKEELDHAARLRRERRRAWRQEHDPTAGLAARGRPGSLDELLSRSAPMERAAAAAHRDLAVKLRAEGHSATAALFEHAATDEEALAGELEDRLGRRFPDPSSTAGARSAFEGLRLLETAFDRYSDAAEHATDEPMMMEAQRLTERALHRLARVHGPLAQSR